MSIPGTIQFPALATTPSSPPTGSYILYVKTDNTIYLEDSSGNTYAFGSTTSIDVLTGDVSATGPGTAVATVNFVGGQSAANVASATAAYLLATNNDTPNTLILRDAYGNFSAGTITANLTGNASTSTVSINFSGSLVGDVTGTQTATVVAFVGGQSASSIATSVVATQDATALNTASTLVERDSSGNFSASTITANLNGNASTATNSTNFTGSLSGDVTGTQSSTSISSTTVTGKLLTGYIVGTNTPLTSTDSILEAFQNIQAQINSLTGSAITALTGDVSATGPGSTAATVNSVGGQTASAIASTVTTVSAATSSDTPSTLVERNASGNFSAGTITASLTGVASGNLVQPTNKVIVQKNPGTGQFSSVAAAVASITTASSTNPFLIQVEPGIYIESPFTMKEYVYIVAVSSGSVTLVTNSPNTTFITGIDNSGISHCIIDGATGANGIGLFHQGTTGNAFIVEFCIFTNCTTCISTYASLGNPSKLELVHCFFVAPFTTGLLASTDSISSNQILVNDTVYSNTTGPYAGNIIIGHGSGLLLYLSDCQFTQSGGNCIVIYDGAEVFLSSVGILGFAYAFWVQNTGAAVAVSVNGLQTLNNTVDVQVDHTSATGSISGAFSASNSTISSNSVSIFTADPAGGITFTGDLSFGSTFSAKTDVTDLILGGPAMGVYSGGTLTPGSGFTIDVAAGTGYYSIDIPDVYFTWNSTSITLTANSSNYIYFNSSGILTSGSSFPDTRSNILLGRVVTNSSSIEFIDASPLTAQHYGNLNDNFLREALGPVFSYGCTVVEDSVPLHLDVSAGSYYFGNNNFQPSAETNITFQTFYQNGSGGYNIGSTNTVDTNNYDNGSGTLQPIPSGYYARHTLYIVGQGANQQYLFVYSQYVFPTLILAQTGNIPTPPPYFTDGVVLLASIIVLQGSTSIISGGGQIVDNRPRIGFSLPAVEAVGSVTSVALALPSSVFSVSGSPVTSSGTLTGSLITQSANTVWAGPTSGSSSTPTFRNLVSADIPDNAANTTGTASNITATSNSTLTTLSNLSLPGSQVTGNISGTASNITATSNTTLTSLPDLTLPTSQLSGDISLTGQVSGILPIANGGTNNSSFTNGSVIFSNGSSLTQNNSDLYWDNTNIALGVGTVPSTTAVVDIVNNSGSTKAVQLTGYSSNVGVRGRYANGTLSSPTAATTGNVLEFLSGRGYGATGFAASSTGAINIVAGSTFTDASMPTYLQFETTPSGSTTIAESARIASTGVTLGPQSSSTAIHNFNGGISRTTNTISSSTYTVDSVTTDYTIFTNSTSNTITITLPTATNGRTLIIQDKVGQASINHITITPPGSVYINGVNASISIAINYGGWALVADGSNWTAYALLPVVPPVQAISASNIDWSTSNSFTKTLSANTTFTFSNAVAGQTIIIRLTNTASNYTVTWPTIKWPVQTTPVMTTGAFSDIYTIFYDGSNYYGSYVQNY